MNQSKLGSGVCYFSRVCVCVSVYGARMECQLHSPMSLLPVQSQALNTAHMECDTAVSALGPTGGLQSHMGLECCQLKVPFDDVIMN